MMEAAGIEPAQDSSLVTIAYLRFARRKRSELPPMTPATSWPAKAAARHCRRQFGQVGDRVAAKQTLALPLRLLGLAAGTQPGIAGRAAGGLFRLSF
jgi:hypothetical protein